MKTLALCLFLLTTKTALACSCFSSEAIVIHSLAEMQSIPQEEVRISNLKESYNVVLGMPHIIRGALTRDEGMECKLSCSLKGVKVVADVEYKKEEKICSAKLIKSAQFEDKIKLKDVKCL